MLLNGLEIHEISEKLTYNAFHQNFNEIMEKYNYRNTCGKTLEHGGLIVTCKECCVFFKL